MNSQADTGVVERITLSLIHDFELRYDGVLVHLEPSSQRLVCFLALQGRPVRRSYVSGALWSDATESRANASLRSALWRASSPTRSNLVQASKTHIWLNPHVEVDLRQAIATAVAVLDGRIAEINLINVARELCAFGDGVLVGWYDDWVIMERERFRQLRLHALDQVGDQLLLARRYCDALQVGLASVAAEPLRESAHRLLVRTHLYEGNVAEAMRQYRSYARLLAEELGARPSAAMDDLLREYARPSANAALPHPRRRLAVLGVSPPLA